MSPLADLPRRLGRPLAPLVRRTPLEGLAGGPERVLLELDLGRGLAESPPSSPLAALRSRHTPLLRTLVAQLRRAEQDDDVVGLVASVGDGGLTLAQSEELRAAVHRFAATGRPTLAWSASFGEVGGATTGYHLATAFDEIWLQPSGAVGLTGFAAEALFVRGALDRLGVEPQMFRRHEYKSAADLLLREEISAPHREMLERLLASCTDTVVDDVAAARGLEPDDVRALVEAGPAPAERALEAGLVDHLGYRDQARTALRERLGVPADRLTPRYVERHRVSRLEGWLGELPTPGGRRPVIGVVQASGAIHLGRTSPQPGGGPSVGADELGAALRAAGRAEQVRAVVLRIDSPGGSYVASDSIRREIQVLRESGTPVVASMGSVAGSGGYFIAMPCTEVLAGAGTITGSIGVVAGKLVLREALARVGVTRSTVAGSRHAAMLSSNQALDDEQVAMLDGWLDDVYDDFTRKAAGDRGLPLADLQEVAKGRIWSGADAVERGLVDRIGGLQDAVTAACRLAGLDRDDVEVRAVPKPNPFAAFSPPESSESMPAAAAVPLIGEGPVAWQRLVAGLVPELGAPFAGVLSLPPWRLPGLLPG